MERLQYTIEDSTIAELLGVQSFTSDEAAVLELVKNAYDARASSLVLDFASTSLTVSDNGVGMNESDIKEHWMRVGKSSKDYEIFDENNHKRILAGSKGVGRFALSRLGRNVQMYTKKKNSQAVLWSTDWNESTLEITLSPLAQGTIIIIENLREKWGKKKIQRLAEFLSKTYNDDCMKIDITHPEIQTTIPRFFSNPELGKNCLTCINLKYDSNLQQLTTQIISDEFSDLANAYCPTINLQKYSIKTNLVDEFKDRSSWDLDISNLVESLSVLGDFSAQFYFSITATSVEMEKFLYKHSKIPAPFKGGIILYRNAFSIASYEGKKDWLGLGIRSRKSPAAASHPTGAWRVRENQLSGKVEIDKKRNHVLQDLSNRQGLDENLYYEIFMEILLTGIKEFERYRQAIIRNIDVKNNIEQHNNVTPISNKIVSNPKIVSALSIHEAKQLAAEIKEYKKESSDFKREKADVEERYRYDVRILNVLATTGLKASSIAHEMRNDRNVIADNTKNIIEALQEYGMWEELNIPERTERIYQNVPHLLEYSNTISSKIVAFMDTMLSEVEKKQFESSLQDIFNILINIKNIWERDYAWVKIEIDAPEHIDFPISEDILQVVFDNLILNSIQQNENISCLNITISITQTESLLYFKYTDDGKGLDEKYASNPRKILEVHETTRKNGHGLGMWIINNTTVMSGGQIIDIAGKPGFSIEFTIGGKI